MFDEEMPTDDATNLDQLVTWAGAVAAAMLARKALSAAWTAVTGEDPPSNPAGPDTRWREALLWGAAAGLVAGLGRTVGRRLASSAVTDT